MRTVLRGLRSFVAAQAGGGGVNVLTSIGIEKIGGQIGFLTPLLSHGVLFPGTPNLAI
jgi:hypothetical protein